jgi:predicted GIY-YIG superfamily endonuclease
MTPVEPAEIWLYVLELENAHYYVGQSIDVDVRVKAHRDGKGSAWTRLHPFHRELRRQPTGTNDWKIAEAYENKWTLELMSLRGWEMVRGGYWCNTCPIQTRKGLIAHGHSQLVGAVARIETTQIESESVLISKPPVTPLIVYKKRRSIAV